MEDKKSVQKNRQKGETEEEGRDSFIFCFSLFPKKKKKKLATKNDCT